MRFSLAALLIFALVLPTVASAQQESAHAEADVPKLGIVVLVPTKGNNVRGVLRLQQDGETLTISGQVRNLTPGEHGFHIHEFGDLRGTDGTSAGGHFNPAGHEHGAPGPESHAGDLGNITANEQGVARVNVTTKDANLHTILGRSIVVHAGKDDLQSQPSGDAGARVAVGVIGVGNPEVQGPGRRANR